MNKENLLDFLINPKTFLFVLKTYILYFLGIKTKSLKIKTSKFNINKSFIRWGDGETMSCLGLSFSYQKRSKLLANYLKKILFYKGDEFILGLPLHLITKEENKTNFLRVRILTRSYFNKYLNLNKYYGDAFYFRNLNLNKFESIYENKNIFLISNKNSINKAEKYNLNIVGSYEIPKINAFDNYINNYTLILEYLKKHKKENMVILISSGPTAKALCYDLTIKEGYICHDIGAFIDLN